MLDKIFHECFPSSMQVHIIESLRHYLWGISITADSAQLDLDMLLTKHASNVLHTHINTGTLRRNLGEHCWDSFNGVVRQLQGLTTWVQNPYCFQEWADIARFTSDFRLTLSSILGVGSMTLFLALLDVLRPVKDKDTEYQ